MAYLGNRNVAHKTIKAYITGVRSYHVDLGYTDLDVFHHPMLERILAGIRRLRGEPDRRERKPITRDLLLQIIKTLDTSTQRGATLHAAFCLAFAAFLRIGEFTYSDQDRQQLDFGRWHATRSSIVLEQDKLQLSLPASKTDPFRQGVTLTIAAAGDEACPVASLRYLLERFPSLPSAPLFETALGFNRQLVIEALRSTLLNLGHTGNYSGHSFRRGAATSARRAGLTEQEIQLLGRWRSDAYKLYIQAHPSYILNASRRQQGWKGD